MQNLTLKAFAYRFLLLITTTALQSTITLVSESSTIKLSGTNAQLILSAGAPLAVGGTIYADSKSATTIQGTTTNDTLNFTNGFLQTNATGKSQINGTFDPTSADVIKLGSNQTLTCDNNTLIEGVEVSGTGGAIRGQPLFASDITLVDNATTLTMAIQNKLNVNVTMNGGTITMTDDLSLEADNTFVGDGTVDINNKQLSIGPATWGAGEITFLNANDITLTGYTTLNSGAVYNFQGNGASSVLNGAGNTLNIDAGGIIRVRTNHTLYMVDINIHGLGAGHGNFDIFSTGTIRMFNTTITLNGSFSHDAGTIVAQGGRCMVIAKSSDKFNIIGATLTVDGIALLYDPLDTTPTDPNPFVTSSGGTITYLNNGLIRANSPNVSGGNLGFSSNTPSLGTAQILGPNSKMTVINATVGTPKAVTLDGQGNFIQFNYSTTQYWTIQENVTLTLTNVMIKDFDQSLIDFQGAGGTLAKLQFGDNCIVSFGKNTTISSTPLTFVGNATLDTGGNTITLASSGAIDNTTAGKTLTIKNGNLVLSNATAIRATNDTAKIVLQNTNITANNVGFTYSQGSLDLQDKVTLSGLDQTASGGTSIFTFASKGLMTVKSGSSLIMDRGMTFSYNPNTTSDGTNAVKKRHLKLNDPSATLNLNGCTFYTGLMGMALDYGRLLIDGKSVMNISPATGAEVEFGTALDVQIASGAILDINGALKYTSTTYP